jgi:integrase
MSRKRLPSRLHQLSVREVQAADEGDHSDGGGLRLCIRGDSATWVLRYTAPNGKRREMGLGTANRSNAQAAGNSLTDARVLANEAHQLLLKAIDPIDDRDARKAAKKAADEVAKQKLKRDALTLARAARQYHERVIEGHRSDKHSTDWINSLEQHVPSATWHRAIAEVSAPELLDFFVAIRRSHRETGRRIVQRLCKIYSDAVFRGLANGNVAAAAAERLRELGIKREVISYAALPIEKVPRFIGRLRERDGIAARALEFAVLTAARTGEVLGATWDEFDLDARLWTVPADRMKGGDKHVVYLSPRAIEIVESMRAFKQPYVFPGPKLDQTPLSNMAMLTLLRRMDAAKATTVHGLCRACFFDVGLRDRRGAPGSDRGDTCTPRVRQSQGAVHAGGLCSRSRSTAARVGRLHRWQDAGVERDRFSAGTCRLMLRTSRPSSTG